MKTAKAWRRYFRTARLRLRRLPPARARREQMRWEIHTETVDGWVLLGQFVSLEAIVSQWRSVAIALHVADAALHDFIRERRRMPSDDLDAQLAWLATWRPDHSCPAVVDLPPSPLGRALGLIDLYTSFGGDAEEQKKRLPVRMPRNWCKQAAAQWSRARTAFGYPGSETFVEALSLLVRRECHRRIRSVSKAAHPSYRTRL